MKKIMFIFGTRPEAIKMAPVIKEFKQHSDKVDLKICLSAQHRELVDQVLTFFDLKPDYDLNIMKPDQNLFDLTCGILNRLKEILDEAKPDLVFVQGDTTTALAGALAAFYQKIKIAHIEAGLRSYNKYAPFPEEINRILISRLADYHFVPTKTAEQNLINEGIKEKIYLVGNTVIDALFLTLDIIKNKKGAEELILNYFSGKIPGFNKILSSKIILVTAHRRESFGPPLNNICSALKEIALNNPKINIIYPVHLNPNVRNAVSAILGEVGNIHLIEPLGYPELVYLLDKSYLILTDSGGVQEEAPSLGKPVLVMRDVTERKEGLEAKTAKLTGTDKRRIIDETMKLLNNENEYRAMKKVINPYGDGKSSKKIVEIILREFL